MAEAAAKHPWTIAKDAKWPAGIDTPDVEFKLVQIDTEREPLLSNAQPLEIH